MEPVLTEDDRVRLANQANNLSILAVALCLLASCGGCITVFLAFPLAMWSMSLARTALNTPEPSELVAAWAGPARILSLVALIYSGLMGSLILLYVGTYMAMFAVLMLGAFL